MCALVVDLTRCEDAKSRGSPLQPAPDAEVHRNPTQRASPSETSRSAAAGVEPFPAVAPRAGADPTTHAALGRIRYVQEVSCSCTAPRIDLLRMLSRSDGIRATHEV